MQLLRSHTKAIMLLKGMWLKLIKKYLDCRYVYALEVVWRVFKFDMHERFPAIERLQYHLPNQQMVLFDDDDDVQEVVAWSAISKRMLME